MPTYLLPCSCGRTIPVEPRQAGQQVNCACGKASLVPTWRQMATLEQSEGVDTPQAPRSGWGGAERLIFVGAVLALAFLALAAGVCWNRPEAPPEQPTPAEIENAPPGETVAIFHWLVAAGLDDGSKDQQYQAYLRKMARYRLWLGLLGVAAAAGVVLVGLGVAGRYRARRGDSGF
jgi:hypothetical protein